MGIISRLDFLWARAERADGMDLPPTRVENPWLCFVLIFADFCSVFFSLLWTGVMTLNVVDRWNALFILLSSSFPGAKNMATIEMC